jgi:hypothetical protein
VKALQCFTTFKEPEILVEAQFLTQVSGQKKFSPDSVS